LNIGILMGPYLSTQILSVQGYQGIFIVKLLINIFVFIVAYFGLNHFNKKCDFTSSITGLIKLALKRKDIMRIYSVAFVLHFFYAIMVIYTPIYLQQIGMAWSEIGLLFTIMLVPFVLIQYPLGILADKKIGEKELIIMALCIMVPSVLIIYFVNNTNFAAWALILFTTRVGAAMLEVMVESYFFKRIDADDIGLINFYRTATPFAYIIAAGLTAMMLFFLPIKSLFILLTVVLVIGIYPASRLIDNPSETEIIQK
jgi:MFS family permease